MRATPWVDDLRTATGRAARPTFVGLALWASACWTTAPKAPSPPAPAASDTAITDDHFGPLGPQSPATLAAMRKAFPQFTVVPHNDESGLEYHALAGSAEMFYVVTNDDLSIFNVHAEDARFVDREHGWHVGGLFQDSAKLDHCECWGEHPTCYKRGDHVAVNFDRECDGLSGAVDHHAYRALDGLAPRAVIWNPQPFGSDEDSGEADGVEGGAGSGSDAPDDGD